MTAARGCAAMRAMHPTDAVAHARKLGPEIAAAADEIERARRLTPAIVEQLHKAGLFRLLLPRSLGGAEAPPQVLIGVLEELGRQDGSVAWCVSIANSTALIAAFLDPEPARQIFADHPGWPVIDVTGRAIEETAVIILESLKERDETNKNARAAIV